MRTLISRALGLFLTIAFLSSCGTKEEVVITANPRIMGDEDLSLAGEQLLSPYTFMLADSVFKEALKKDPGNYRAQFYTAFLKPLMVFRGIHARLRPFVRAHGDIKQWESDLEKDIPNSAIKDFILRGPEDIQNSARIQDVLVEYREALLDFYKFLKSSQGTKLTLNLPQNILNDSVLRNTAQYCRIIRDDINNGGEARVECDRRDMLQRRIADADNIALRQIVASKIMYVMFYTTYTVEGIEELSNRNEEREMTTEELSQKLESLPRLGKLRKDAKFNLIKTFGSDALSAYRIFSKRQAELCPSKAGSIKRRGHLFDSGFCITTNSEDLRNIQLIENILNGHAVTINMADAMGADRRVTLNPSKFIDSPARDIRQLLPATFNECGEGTSLTDKTLGGIFPNRDAENFVLKKVCR